MQRIDLNEIIPDPEVLAKILRIVVENQMEQDEVATNILDRLVHIDQGITSIDENVAILNGNVENLNGNVENLNSNVENLLLKQDGTASTLLEMRAEQGKTNERLLRLEDLLEKIENNTRK